MTEPYIHISPGMRGGEPVIGGTRLPAEQIAWMWWGGLSTQTDIQRSYPSVTRAHLIVACWYVTRFKPRTWRKRWGEWAHEWFGAMWHGAWEEVPLPPQEVPK
jgi:uncharacterized protein (DUF433 family)